MFPIPPHEQIVEKKNCRLSEKEFFVTDKDLQFYESISPTFAWKKYLIPSPTLCPDERMRRRLSHGEMNENSIMENALKQVIKSSRHILTTKIIPFMIRKFGIVMTGILMNFAQILISLGHFSRSLMILWNRHQSQRLQMDFEKMLTTVTNVIISKIATCVSVQITQKIANISTVHLNQRIALIASM